MNTRARKLGNTQAKEAIGNVAAVDKEAKGSEKLEHSKNLKEGSSQPISEVALQKPADDESVLLELDSVIEEIAGETEDEERIEYINLDEIDGSDSEEPSRISEAVASMDDRVMDEDVMEYLKALGLKGSPDSLELEILKMPTLDVVTAETRQVREFRRLLFYPLTGSDLAHSVVQGILSRSSCVGYTIKGDRSGDNHGWNGSAVLNFSTASAASMAASELRQMRRSLHIEQGNAVDSKFNRLQPHSSEKDWTDMMLVIKNIGDSATEKVLAELFPEADVIIHKDRTGSSAKGHAYLLYGTKEQAKEVLEKYSEKKLEINGRRIILLKWRQTLPKIVPEGMLRIGERRLIMKTLEETNEKSEKLPDSEYLQAKVRFLQDLIVRDDGIRKLVGLPQPTFEQLKKLSTLRQFGESENNQILKRILDPFERQTREKEKPKEKEGESEREKEKSKSQESGAKSKSKPNGDGKGPQKSKSDNRSNVKRNLPPSKGKMSYTFRSDHSSSKHGPVPLLSTPLVSGKRNSGTGLLGSGPADPTLSLLLQQQQQQQQQRVALVQPLLGPQSLLSQPLIQSSGYFGVGNQANSVFGKQPSLLGSYPGESTASKSFSDEPYQKIGRYAGMQSVKDDLFLQSFDDRAQEVHAREYDHGRRGGSKDRLDKGYGRDYRNERDGRADSRRDRNDQYYRSERHSSDERNMEMEHLFRDEHAMSSRGLFGGRPEDEGTSSRSDYRRDWEKRSRYDDHDERHLLGGRGEDRLTGMDEDASRRQLASGSAKADPVSLLLNLSQLLAEKMQRDKEKGQRGGTY